MTVFFLPRDSGPPPQQTKAGDPGPARVGFTVPRALGTAVERNRIRRRMREAARLNLGAAGGGVDVVIHPKKSALRAEFAELCQEVARAFEKIKSQV
jgi:ribonuclease P protein component